MKSSSAPYKRERLNNNLDSSRNSLSIAGRPNPYRYSRGLSMRSASLQTNNDQSTDNYIIRNQRINRQYQRALTFDIVDSESIRETFVINRNNWDEAAKTMTPEGVLPGKLPSDSYIKTPVTCMNRLNLVDSNIMDWPRHPADAVAEDYSMARRLASASSFTYSADASVSEMSSSKAASSSMRSIGYYADTLHDTDFDIASAHDENEDYSDIYSVFDYESSSSKFSGESNANSHQSSYESEEEHEFSEIVSSVLGNQNHYSDQQVVRKQVHELNDKNAMDELQNQLENLNYESGTILSKYSNNRMDPEPNEKPQHHNENTLEIDESYENNGGQPSKFVKRSIMSPAKAENSNDCNPPQIYDKKLPVDKNVEENEAILENKSHGDDEKPFDEGADVSHDTTQNKSNLEKPHSDDENEPIDEGADERNDTIRFKSNLKASHCDDENEPFDESANENNDVINFKSNLEESQHNYEKESYGEKANKNDEAITDKLKLDETCFNNGNESHDEKEEESSEFITEKSDVDESSNSTENKPCIEEVKNDEQADKLDHAEADIFTSVLSTTEDIDGTNNLQPTRQEEKKIQIQEEETDIHIQEENTRTETELGSDLKNHCMDQQVKNSLDDVGERILEEKLIDKNETKATLVPLKVNSTAAFLKIKVKPKKKTAGTDISDIADLKQTEKNIFEKESILEKGYNKSLIDISASKSENLPVVRQPSVHIEVEKDEKKARHTPEDVNKNHTVQELSSDKMTGNKDAITEKIEGKSGNDVNNIRQLELESDSKISVGNLISSIEDKTIDDSQINKEDEGKVRHTPEDVNKNHTVQELSSGNKDAITEKIEGKSGNDVNNIRQLELESNSKISVETLISSIEDKTIDDSQINKEVGRNKKDTLDPDLDLNSSVKIENNSEAGDRDTLDQTEEFMSENEMTVPDLSSLVQEEEEEEADNFPLYEDVASHDIGIEEKQNGKGLNLIYERPGSPHPCSPQQSLQDEDSIAMFSDTTFPVSNVSKPHSTTHTNHTDDEALPAHRVGPSASFESDIQDIVVESNDGPPASPGSAIFPDRIECWSHHLSNGPEFPTMDSNEHGVDDRLKDKINQDARKIIDLEDFDGKPYDLEPEMDEELNPSFSDDDCVQGNEVNSTESSNDEKDTTTTADTLEFNDDADPKSVPIGLNLQSSPLPNADHVHNTGVILTRTSWRTILMRKWQRSVWVHYGRASLFIFRTEEDVNSWLSNPNLTLKQRNALIKVKLDFSNEVSKSHVRGYQLTCTKAKVYEKSGPSLFNFKVEKWLELDKHITAAFASPKKEELETLRSVIQSCLDNCPWNGLKSIKDLLIQEKTVQI